MKIDPFANHASALKLRASRNEVLAGNIANADTPNYKARDFDFAEALAAQQSAGGGGDTVRLLKTQPGHFGVAAGAASNPTVGYRIPSQPAVDGNTVETDIEQAAYAENVVGYQASLNFINQKIRGLRTAIKGEI
ncbi:MAG: flagellar basal body rod protein FlgB [Pseudomonadota bacterium]